MRIYLVILAFVGSLFAGNQEFETIRSKCFKGSGMHCEIVGQAYMRGASKFKVPQDIEKSKYYLNLACTKYHEKSACESLDIMLQRLKNNTFYW
jgi:TPR repeat protein